MARVSVTWAIQDDPTRDSRTGEAPSRLWVPASHTQRVHAEPGLGCLRSEPASVASCTLGVRVLCRGLGRWLPGAVSPARLCSAAGGQG